MSDNDKQLTVAELLARANKDKPEGEADRPRRRRRRSLDEGGVSVAELTGSFRKVEERPAESRHSSVPIDAPAEPETVAEPEKVEEPVQQVEEQLHDEAPAEEVAPEVAEDAAPEEPVETVEEDLEEDPEEDPEEDAVDATDEVDEADETNIIPVVPEAQPDEGSADSEETPVVAEALSDETAEVSVVDVPEDQETAAESTALISADQEEVQEGGQDTDLDTEDEESSKINVLALIGMILGGLVLAVAVFFGFKWMWANLNGVVVAVLGVVVTLGMMGVIRKMLSERDGLSMTLSAIVGLLMTFGPALIVLL